MEPEILTKMFRNLSEKRGREFPATTLSYSMVKIAHLNDAFSELFELEASPVEGQSMLQRDKKRGKRKGKKVKKIFKKLERPKDVPRSLSHPKTLDFCAYPTTNIIKTLC